MAFSRNSSDEAVEQIALNERSHLHQLAINSSSRLKEKAMMNNEEMSDPTPDNNAGEDSRSNLRMDDDQPPIRGTSVGGKWGSNFWKDYQPARTSHRPSESGEESKSGSEYKGSDVEESDGVEDRMESENDDITHKDLSGKGHQTVPADEMLSDDYYEQDGDDPPNESVNHYRAGNHSTGYSSKPPSRPPPSHISRKSKELKTNKYSDEDADFEDDDDDEDEDDPDDADFDPDFAARSRERRIKDKDEGWDAEESDEDDNIDDEDLDVSDEDDPYLEKSKTKQSSKSSRNLKSTREFKPVASSTRRKKGRASFEEDDEESSADDLENGSDEEFRSTRRGAQVHRKSGGRSVTVSISSRKNELRTSGRSVRKVSYVESDGSEDIDEVKKKNQKEEIEEEDGDAIEKVLWHQRRGTAEEALRNNKSTDPVLLSYSFDTELDWNDMEFLIKWKGQSHLHCQWKSFSELQNLSGFKKVLNYTKKVMEDVKYRRMVSREEIEVNDVSKEMDLDIIKQNSQVERVIAERVIKDSLGDVISEYLIKWQGLSYAEATWEKDIDISFAQEAVDEYNQFHEFGF